jgi:ribosomal-protein-alanine N-acetyltransferase
MDAGVERYVLRTPRLVLRPFASSDATELHPLFTHPGVRRFLLDDEIVPPAWVEAEIAASSASFAEHGFGLWTARLDHVLIGFAGFRPFHDPPELQLLYGLHPDYWHRGLATEAAAAVLTYGFEALRFATITASTDAPNAASVRVMERLGMRFQKRIDRGGLDTIYYELDRSTWEG